jgi:hypothetical protein
MKQDTLRNSVFWGVLTPLICFLIPFEYFDWYDSAFIVYSLVVFFVTTCLCFWLFWGVISIRPPSTFFKIIILLMMGIDFVWSSNLYSRYLYVTDLEAYHQWMKSNIFAYRPALLVVIFIWILAWTVGRFFGKQEELLLNLEEGHLLVVDDELSMCDLVENCAQSVNISSIDIAHDYKSAMELFQPGKYTCILIDLKLTSSVKDGAVLATDIREKDSYVAIGILTGFISGIQTELLIIIDDIIEKPFSINLLKVKLRLLCYLGQKRRFMVQQHNENR